MLHESPVDSYRIAEHAKRLVGFHQVFVFTANMSRCLPLLQDHPKREELLHVLMQAGEEAWNRGAHELAMRSFRSAKALLKDPWRDNPDKAFILFSRLAS